MDSPERKAGGERGIRTLEGRFSCPYSLSRGALSTTQPSLRIGAEKRQPPRRGRAQNDRVADRRGKGSRWASADARDDLHSRCLLLLFALDALVDFFSMD